MRRFEMFILTATVLVIGTGFGASTAAAGTITAVGAVTALTDVSEVRNPEVGDFNEGPVNTNIPLGIYTARGLTFHVGSFAAILPGIVSTGTASNPGYRTYTNFPSPAGGGSSTGFACRVCGVATFGHVVTQVGLTASTNGTQYITAWDTSGALIGQVRWVPSGDSAFVGLDTGGVPIGMVSYGNDDMFGGATYSIGGSTIQSDTWVWNGTCNFDGIADAGEECDDGNMTDGDGCSALCQLEFCGNGTMDPGELCDDGNEADGDGCSGNCLSDETCGNSRVDPAAGEECDDGGTTAGDGCSGVCLREYCGNGRTDAGEECDDGNVMSGDGCASDCGSDETCGNGSVDVATGEGCDDGNAVDGDGCQADCMLPTCGDGIADAGEVCDDGNNVSGDGCGGFCSSDETCGNSTVDVAAGEACDDGNTDADDGCSATCVVEYCGNGAVEAAEVCDDGNNASGDGCAGNCGSDESCGNGLIDPDAGEACDDGNTVSGDGCQADCTLPNCGDGSVDPGEVCDDGNTDSGDGCNSICMSDETCGNGVVDDGEGCDDGNTDDGDSCSASCTIPGAPLYCGNGVVDGTEVCDDGNTMSGDGCDAACASLETCGNGTVDVAVGELCDDGNTTDGDGCSATCTLPSCGNGVTEGAEVCDDGNSVSGDGCNATCSSVETCGNGVVDTGEFCDQGDDNNDAGPCDTSCDVVLTTTTTTASGGCGCGVMGASQRGGFAWLALGLSALFFYRRRRR